MSELKCCPFCGGEAKIVKYCGNKTIVYVECTNCLAYMGNQRIMTSSSRGKEYFESEEKLINAWNRRTTMDNIVQKLEELPYGRSYHDYAEKGIVHKYLERNDVLDIVKQEINNGLE